jgi:hypothetical protein
MHDFGLLNGLAELPATSRETVAVAGASHVVMMSHPDAVAEMIEKAADSN